MERITCTRNCYLCKHGELIKEGEVYAFNDTVYVNIGKSHYICDIEIDRSEVINKGGETETQTDQNS